MRGTFEEIVRQLSLDQHKHLLGPVAPGDAKDQLTTTLLKDGKFIFVMVDELDEMYRLNKDDHPKGSFNANQTLGQLSSLGNESSGCYFTIVCGSSASLPLLLQARGDYVDKGKYHLKLVYVNCNKYPAMVVTNPPPNSLETVRSMINGHRLPTHPDVERLIREATFFTGGNARLLTAYLRNTKEYHADTIHREDGTHDAKLSQDHNQLRDAIYRQLAETHQQDLKEIINDGKLDITAITDERLRKLAPITEQETLKLCNKVLPRIDEKRFTQLLNDLADHGYITLDGENVYPKTMFALAHYARKVGIVHW